jgi:hypothetical protein
MIVFNLSCGNDHRFEGWFSSTEDFAAQSGNGDVCCPVCGSSQIARQLSAPYVSTSKRAPSENSTAVSVANSAAMLKEKFMAFVLKNTEDVGDRFPEEARKIHYKEAEERAIRGSASPDEVSALRDEGIDVMAVPAVPAAPDKLH